MVKIAVFDVPATEGGAIGILNEYYDRAINDTETDWLFVVSIDTLQPRDNIKIIKLPWIKKSWLHRIYFELFIAHRIVRENNIDKILSLHNLVIPFAKVTNEVYFHQALIFSDIRYSIIKNLKLWVYQNVLSILFVRSLKHASRVIVQTHFLAQILNVGLGIPLSKITIKSPTLRPEVKHIHYSSKNIRSRPLQFIYPAAPYDYKCHQDIIDALKLMNANELENINIKFTFTGQENHNAERLRREINEYHLPVDLVGYIDYKEMIKQYEYSALLFTSSIESYGIPLLEARTTGAPVIASATVFAREILSGYRNACYYEPGSPHSLAAALSDYIANKKILESQKVYEFSQLIFIGGMYGEGYETDYLENTRTGGIQTAVNTHQWNIVKGMSSTPSSEVYSLSAPYLSTYPTYRKLIVKKVVGALFHSVQYLNLPIVRNVDRTLRLCVATRAWLRKTDNNKNRTIVSYYVSLPQMIAATLCTNNVTKIIIIPDLPTYLNLSQNQRLVSKAIGKVKVYIINSLINRYDGYVLLTKHMTEALGLDPSKCLISEGCVADADIMDEYEVSSRRYEKNIVYAGGLHEKYGVKNLIDAMSYIDDKDVNLYIFGSGEMEEEIKDRSIRDSRIKYMGYKSRISVLECQKKAKVLINPRDANYEYVRYSFPSKNLEYLACGALVVCCKLPCIEEEYDDVFFYSKSGSAKDLANTISRCMELPEQEARAASLRATRFIKKNKSSSVQGQRILNFIKTLQATNKRGRRSE